MIVESAKNISDSSNAFNVIEHGVVPDGRTPSTAALQSLIDRCVEAGGGTLVFPAGRYLTGGLVLGDDIHLRFEAGATLLGSTDLADYHHYDPSPVPFYEGIEGVRALIFAHGAKRIRLSGGGTVDGQGALVCRNNQPGVRASLPRNLLFIECEDIVVEGVRLRNSGFWMQHYLKCTKVRLHGIDVFNHGGSNSDGCDFDSCRDVIMSDCTIDSHDDAIVLKSGTEWPTENVVITNCITRTHCNHFKTGTESNGGFRNITVSNMQMVPSSITETSAGTEGADWRGACGIALGCVDGGMLENISVSHVQMDQVRVPFFIKLGNRGRSAAGTIEDTPVQYAQGVRIAQVNARRAGTRGCYIMGLPGHPVCDVRIEHCDLEFEGGANDAIADAAVPSRADAYPSSDAYGDLPSFGIFLRDVEGVRLTDITLRTMSPDARPGLRWQRVAGLSMDRLSEI